MAQRTIVTITDDIDGGDADETVKFGLDGDTYEIDLSTANAATFRQAFAPFKAAARRVKTAGTAGKADPRAASPARRTPPGATNGIREWARDNGFSVSDKGRIPGNVLDAYKVATSSK